MPLDVEASQYRTTIRDRVIYLAEDFERELRPDARGMRELSRSEAPQIEALVQHKTNGSAFRIFVLIGLFLVVAMVSIATYTHR